jgi:hypothetical protein
VLIRAALAITEFDQPSVNWLAGMIAASRRRPSPVLWRVGFHDLYIEARSTLTRVAACAFAPRFAGLYPMSLSHLVASMALKIAAGWGGRVAGWGPPTR